MAAALRDYSNSFNSLQSASQVRHPIIVLRPPFGEESGGERRGAGSESHVLCAAAAADRIPASTVWTAQTVTVGGVVDAGGAQLCGNTP